MAVALMLVLATGFAGNPGSRRIDSSEDTGAAWVWLFTPEQGTHSNRLAR